MAKLTPVPEPVLGATITPQWGLAVRQHTQKSLAQLGDMQGDMIALNANLQPQKIARPENGGVLYHPGGNSDHSYVPFKPGTPSTGDFLVYDDNTYQPQEVIPDGMNAGDMMYWDGSKFVRIPRPTATGRVLGLVNGVPTWIAG